MKRHKYEAALLVLFVATIPLINPWVRGDGVGYYALARSLYFEHKLDFTEDWLRANATFREGRVDSLGHIRPEEYTPTGHIDNHFAVGPAILWLPFLLAASAMTHVHSAFGGRLAQDGYAAVYLRAIALGTALYGFGAVWLSFQIARKYLAERWAFLAALGIWFASSLPVYMYFNPSWAHAHSAFTVALFIWYWDRTRGNRTFGQWMALGAIGGLMVDVYYPNAILLLFPGLESLALYRGQGRGDGAFKGALILLWNNVLFVIFLVIAFLPTLITKKIIYGSYLETGYYPGWHFFSPAFFKVCFSADHGLFTWTPILLLSAAGLVCFWGHDRQIALYALAAFLGYVYFLGCYEDWDGLSSFGSRFCISLTPLFVIGLAAFFERWSAWSTSKAHISAAAATVLLIAWNIGLIFQWGTQMIPARGPVSWPAVTYNQITVVPWEATAAVGKYLSHRQAMMQQINIEDLRSVRSSQNAE